MQMDGKPEPQEIPNDVFEKKKVKAETLYATIKTCYCPFLKTSVTLNTKGLEHIKFKEWNKPRTLFDQYQRLKHIAYIPKALSQSHTVQGRWERNDWERQKKHGKWIKSLKEVIYYEFIAVLDNVRIKVIVKEVKGNPPFFGTIIPFWKTNEVTNSRILHDQDILLDGNFSEDIE